MCELQIHTLFSVRGKKKLFQKERRGNTDLDAPVHLSARLENLLSSKDTSRQRSCDKL
jgi:hypothetical protein